MPNIQYTNKKETDLIHEILSNPIVIKKAAADDGKVRFLSKDDSKKNPEYKYKPFANMDGSGFTATKIKENWYFGIITYQFNSRYGFIFKLKENLESKDENGNLIKTNPIQGLSVAHKIPGSKSGQKPILSLNEKTLQFISNENNFNFFIEEVYFRRLSDDIKSDDLNSDDGKKEKLLFNTYFKLYEKNTFAENEAIYEYLEKCNKKNDAELEAINPETIYDSLSFDNKTLIDVALKTHRPLILSGPPGVGKTSLVKDLADKYQENLNIKDPFEIKNISLNSSVTFESFYGFFNKNQNGNFDFNPGTLLKKLDNILINFDELSRADNDVFAPLLGLLSIDRSSEQIFQIPFSYSVHDVFIGWDNDNTRKIKSKNKEAEYFLFDKSWYFICTMNEEETSLLNEISEAFLRRLMHVRLSNPDEVVVRNAFENYIRITYPQFSGDLSRILKNIYIVYQNVNRLFEDKKKTIGLGVFHKFIDVIIHLSDGGKSDIESNFNVAIHALQDEIIAPFEHDPNYSREGLLNRIFSDIDLGTQ